MYVALCLLGTYSGGAQTARLVERLTGWLADFDIITVRPSTDLVSRCDMSTCLVHWWFVQWQWRSFQCRSVR